ncbi:MAG: thioredoxin family protein [Microbacterium sp.]
MPFSAVLLIVGAVVLLAVAAGVILRAQDGRRRSGGTVRVLAGDLPGGTPTASVTLVQFSTELCARCPQVRRLLSEIATDRGIGHVEVDLTNRRDLASRYQVLQTPTTFLIDAAGVVLSRWGGVPDRRSIEDVIVAVPHGSMPTIRNQEQS